MELFSESQSHKLYQGNMLDMLEVIEPNSIDAIVTDPPYELGFMGKSWDNSGIAFQKETWEKCFKVLKPGGYLLAFGGSRTSHRIACAIEDAGFEIRDTIMWLYGSGFPKSMGLGKAVDAKLGNERIKTGRIIHHAQKGCTAAEERGAIGGGAFGIAHDEEETIGTSEWEGWGTALKPAYEPIIVARKPCEGSCVDNVMKYGVGGINIDECRVPTDDTWSRKEQETNAAEGYQRKNKSMYCQKSEGEMHENGRFPANVILTYDETDQEEVCGGMPDSKGCSTQNVYTDSPKYGGNSLLSSSTPRFGFQPGYNDDGSAARYFYCAKASKRDREEGCDQLSDKLLAMSNQAKAELRRGNVDFTGDPESPLNAFNTVQKIKNNHPTVKPTALMSYLIRLVTPKGGTILDPFNGSGSTGKAAMYENQDRKAGYKYIGIELTPEYLPIADARIRFALGDTSPVEYPSMPVSRPKSGGQISLFDIT